MTRFSRFPMASLVAWICVACVAAPASMPPGMAASATHPPETVTPDAVTTPQPAEGAPLQAVERPDAATCDRMQRKDRVAAKGIRSSVDLSVNDIDASDEAIDSAATDPNADIEVLGIPVRAAELVKLRSRGMVLDGRAPLLFWAQEGRNDLFGGVWIDPPGSNQYVISVVGGETDTLRLARCLERDGIDVRYVMATYGLGELRALQERFNRDWRELEAEGIRIFSSGQHSSENRVLIRIEGLTEDTARVLRERYGDGIELEGLPIPTPRRPLALEEVPFAMGEGDLFGDPLSDSRGGPQGSWRLVDGRLDGDWFRLRLVIEPAAVGLPVASGPAVLFAGWEMFGGTGDVGVSEPMDALATVAIPPCDDRACRYDVVVSLPRAEILPAVRRLENNADEISWLTVNATLVRTFAAGTWLQVLPLQGGDGGASALAGRVGEVKPLDGTLHPFGLIPANEATPIPAGGDGMFTTPFDWPTTVERLRRATGDTSESIETTRASLRVTFDPVCSYSSGIAVHSDTGDTVFEAEAYKREVIDGAFRIPVDIPFRLTLHDGGGIDFDQWRHGWGVRIGDIRSGGEPIEIRAMFACDAPEPPTGEIEVATAS